MGSNASTLYMKTGYRLNPTTSQPHRYPALPHPLLGLLHRVLTIVKNARGQHGVADRAGEYLPEKFLLGSMPFS
jgi:hypothetical protein